MPKRRRTPPDTWTLYLARQLDIPEGQMWQRLRMELGYSVRQVGRRIGVSHNAVHKWEHGENYPAAAEHAKLLALLDDARPANLPAPDPADLQDAT
jgi:transcriptional regulator with XRE-family HTH domain